MTFNNTEFAMFCRCLDDIVEIHFSQMNLSRSQWGIIAKRLSSADAKTQIMSVDSGSQDKEALLTLSSMQGFKLIDKGKVTFFER